LASLRAFRPVLEIDGVLVIGSEVPNLLQHQAASTLVVSQDVDIGVTISRHAEVKSALDSVRGLRPSATEPSVWIPDSPELIEVNLVGMDPGLSSAAESYVLVDERLPLLVFGQLGLLRPGEVLDVEGVRVPLPRPAGVMLEKLLTDRTGEKGEPDLLVVLGILLEVVDSDLDELVHAYRRLQPEARYAVRSNLTILSLLRSHESMPDPEAHRALVASLLLRLEAGGSDDREP